METASILQTHYLCRKLKTLPNEGNLFAQDNDLMEYFHVIENQIAVEEKIDTTKKN